MPGCYQNDVQYAMGSVWVRWRRGTYQQCSCDCQSQPHRERAGPLWSWKDETLLGMEVHRYYQKDSEVNDTVCQKLLEAAHVASFQNMFSRSSVSLFTWNLCNWYLLFIGISAWWYKDGVDICGKDKSAYWDHQHAARIAVYWSIESFYCEVGCAWCAPQW